VKVLGERISNLPYDAGTTTNVAMQTVKESGSGIALADRFDLIVPVTETIA
jgi:predicted RNA-binding protein with TRAM domain